MIDPFTAFAMAQGAVEGIKSAIQLGKDVTDLYKEFTTFFQSADEVHRACNKMRMETIGKTDAQISSESLQIAMQSKQLRDKEKELKDLLFWSGNGQVWEEMMVERVRMKKERTAAEKEIADKKRKDMESLMETLTIVGYCIGAAALIVPIIYGTIYIMSR